MINSRLSAKIYILHTLTSSLVEHSGMTEMLPHAWDTRGGVKGLPPSSQISALKIPLLLLRLPIALPSQSLSVICPLKCPTSLLCVYFILMVKCTPSSLSITKSFMRSALVPVLF